jgi:hypothetical protein
MGIIISQTFSLKKIKGSMLGLATTHVDYCHITPVDIRKVFILIIKVQMLMQNLLTQN